MSAPSGLGPFEADIIQAVAQVREAYARAIESYCPGAKSVSEVSDALGVHRKLAWQIMKVAYADDPFVAARHMPVARSLQTWLGVARDQGVSEDLLRATREAGNQFEAVVSRHASSRAEFDMMIDSFAGAVDIHAEERWRQLAFEGNSYTLGAHCRVLMALCILMPSDDRPLHFHAVQIRGIMGFRQTRKGIRWVINQSVALDDSAQSEIGMQRAAIDPEAARAHNGVPVLPEFCSNPMPALSRSAGPDGMMQDEFLPSCVGTQGERTLVTGEILRNIAPVHATPNDDAAHFGSAVRTPAQMLHFDLFVAAGLFGDVQRELRVFSDLASPVSFDEQDALSVSDQVVDMGRGVSLAQTPDIPGYTDLASTIFTRLHMTPADYELYRVRMAYPPMPTTVMLKHELLPIESFETNRAQ